MKETVNVNIGSQAFVLDTDAWAILEKYLTDIRSRLPKNDTETLYDIETRLAEIFREKIPSPMMVVTLDMVHAAMQQMGSPADFGEQSTTTAQIETECSPRKLYRSRTDRMIGGVCGGIAAYFDIDPTLVRVLMLLLTLPAGLAVWSYVILWVIVPAAPKHTIPPRKIR